MNKLYLKTESDWEDCRGGIFQKGESIGDSTGEHFQMIKDR